MHSVYVFDAYGTLFDTGAAVARHVPSYGEAERELSAIWRRKQLEYSWVRGLMAQNRRPGPEAERGSRHGSGQRNFWQITEDALDHAFEKVPSVDRRLRSDLLKAYRDLDTFEEVPATLRRLKEKDATLVILSNGSRDMLDSAVRAAGVELLFDRIFSAEDCGTYKTAPELYEMVTTHYRLYPDAVSFQSSNRWDIAGASAFGFHTVWINRGREPDEYRDLPPSAVLPDLAGLPDLV